MSILQILHGRDYYNICNDFYKHVVVAFAPIVPVRRRLAEQSGCDEANPYPSIDAPRGQKLRDRD